MIIETVRQTLTQALKNRDEVMVSTLRLLISALEYKRMQKNADLTAEDEIAIVKSEVKKRQEAAAIFRQHNETARAVAEEAELKILETFLPAQMGEKEILAAIEEIKAKLGAETNRGQLIGMVIAKLGRENVDGTLVARMVNQS